MSDEIAHKDGRVERLAGDDVVPAALDTETGVESTDVVICAETGTFVRLYAPKAAFDDDAPRRKLPVLVYLHGGGFIIATAATAAYHNHLNSLVSKSNVVVVCVDYRRAPEHPLPAAYDDSWAALKWVASHSQGTGPSEWLNSVADLDRVYLAGDSAGGNIAHNVAVRIATSNETLRLNLAGIVLVHPFFCGEDLVADEASFEPRVAEWMHTFWRLACPTSSGLDDPHINPEKDPNLGRLGCERVLVCVAEKDFLKSRGWHYKELLEKSGWGGTVEIMEAKEEDHVFHLHNPSSEKAIAMLNKVSSFMSQP